MRSIKYYSNNDLSCGYYLKISEEVLNEFDKGKQIETINVAIELYNIKKFFDNKVYLNCWTNNDVEHYKEIIDEFFPKIAKYYSEINDDNLLQIYKEVEIDYTDDFWELIEKFKVYKKISIDNFNDFLNTSNVSLYELLVHKKITEYFGGIIRNFMLSDTQCAELLLDQYELRRVNQRKALYFPKELTNQDKETIICNYIDSKNPNLNYLRLIANVQSNKDRLELSPKTLLKAERKSTEMEKQYFSENSGLQMGTTVVFSDSELKEVDLKLNGQDIEAIYSSKWIRENSDYATLLNNFIYLFGFVDSQMRFSLVNNFNQMGTFERYLFTYSKNAYIEGIAYKRMDSLSLLQITGYYKELLKFDVRIEEVIEWFFKTYLVDEFKAEGFNIKLPSENSSYLEKCTTIMPALESVLKQFILYVQDGQIDFALLQIRSEQLLYKNIPSLVTTKYVYGIGDVFNTATFFLFSDQSGLGYYEKEKQSYDNFYELICHEKVRVEDYPQYDVSQIRWLIEHEILLISDESYIEFNNVGKIKILKELYFNQVVSYWMYSAQGRDIIDDLEKKNIIKFESTLFSMPEQDYINYFLNKSQYNNGLDLRNKYSHTQPQSENDEEMHFHNYMVFLRIFILSVIKINDDFCTSEKIKNYNKQ